MALDKRLKGGPVTARRADYQIRITHQGRVSRKTLQVRAGLIAAGRNMQRAAILQRISSNAAYIAVFEGGSLLTPESIRSLVALVLFMASAVLLGSVPVAGQSIAEPRTWTVTPFIHTSLGVGFPAPNDSIGIGGAIAYDLTPNLGFEGELSHLFDVDNTADVDWSITNFSVNAVYHFDVQRATPYATFGMGMERSSRTVRNPILGDFVIDPSATEVAVNFGGGVKYLLNERFIARGDLRRFQANDDAPNYWRLYGGVTFFIRRNP